MNDLPAIIRQLIGENGRFARLPRGLCLKFEAQTPAGMKANRLHVYRRDVQPGKRELVIVRQALEPLLGQEPALGSEWQRQHNGTEYRGVTFEWNTAVQQARIPGTDAAQANNYKETK